MSEREILNIFKKYVDVNNRGKLPFGDDAVAIPFDSEYLVINIDGWVASTDRPPHISSYGCGYRAAINAISDIFAKGALPSDLVVSISAPNHKEMEEYIKGIKQAADDYNINFLGGDLNEANDTILDVCVFGRTKSLIRRDEAKIGENVYWIGPNFGKTATALGILVDNWKGDMHKATHVIEHPQLYPEFLELTLKYKVTSAIDCSDGLARSLYFISEMSQVSIELINLNADSWVNDVCNDNNIEVSDTILFGGEELGIIFTSPEEITFPNTTKIGLIKSGNRIVQDNEIIPNKGWEHFSNRE